ncbi:MAG: phosphoribosylglycinamide synthetase, partial [Bifidobacterium crudilactis]|nr:phosphoribosylglycinamide synthetase [Bifidobacterium crudilactis]
LAQVCEQIKAMEGYIPRFRIQEKSSDIDGLSDTLIRITECVAEVRRTYQPDFPLPTFAEIRRVVQEEWDEDMDKIEPMDVNPTAQDIERLAQSDEAVAEQPANPKA